MRKCLLPLVASVVALTAVRPGLAGEKAAPDPAELKVVLDRAIAYLKAHQGKDGSFSPKLAGPGVSALVVAALVRGGVSPREPMMERALAYIEKQMHKDGGVYDYNIGLANYTTSVAVMAFKETNTDGRFDSVLKNAADFLKKGQFDEPESNTADVKYGGFGYDGKAKVKGKRRPDLSNSAFAVEALLQAGVPKDDPSIQKALKFLGRCQNLAGEFNDQEFARNASKDDQGGFTYTPVDPGESHYRTARGGLRSLGAMTYGGLKSFLYAGVSKDDPRVKAATTWIRKHYTLKENPGLGKAGLYYFYHTFAKAMKALGEDPFVDAQGKKHHWRTELFDVLQKQQREDGSWINRGERLFGEGDPNLATAFAVLSLSYCRK
jgi:squalene-hopene/tetraprenyl-beta-curcumene cyclase